MISIGRPANYQRKEVTKLQARYQIQLSPVRGLGLLLALLVALSLAASAGFMAHGAPDIHPSISPPVETGFHSIRPV